MVQNHEGTMIKVVITGVESSGKTTLAQGLAQKYQAPVAAEFARGFLENVNGRYHQNDLDKILKGQLLSEQTLRSSDTSLMICDTGPYVIKVWSMFRYGRVSSYIIEEINKYHADLYVLPDFRDLPYEDDPLREHPDFKDRCRLFDMYLTELINQNAPFIVPSGGREQRLLQVSDVIASLFEIK